MYAIRSYYDPFGINNMYVALATPAIIMFLDYMIPNKAKQRDALANELNDAVPQNAGK